MAGRGMLFAEGPTACPFVALESDRDRRSAEPDPRHRCYAEPTPAPRALAHQREYCLAPGFGGCPIFQDWAIRAAAQPVPLRPASEQPPPPPAGAQQLSAFEAPAAPDAVAPVPAESGSDEVIERLPSLPLKDERARAAEEQRAGEPTLREVEAEGPPPAEPPPAERPPAERPPAEEPPAERPERRWTEDWPPAATAATTAAGDASREQLAPEPVEPPAFLAGQAPQPSEPIRRVDYAQRPDHAQRAEPADRRPPARPSRRDEWAAQRADLIPSWERERHAAYPTLRTRIGLSDSGRSLGRLTAFFGAVAVVFLLVALVILAPGFLPAGGPGPTAPIAGGSPTPTLGPTPMPTPEPTPEPTAQTYRIQAGDTLFGIASRFGLTVDQLLAANPAITNPNLIQVGQVIAIPPDDFGLPTAPPPPTPASSPAEE